MGGRERAGPRVPACPCIHFKRLGVADRRCNLQVAKKTKELRIGPLQQGPEPSLFFLFARGSRQPFIGPSRPHVRIVLFCKCPPFVRSLGGIARVMGAAISSRLIFGVTTKHLGPGYVGLICSSPTHRLHIPLVFPSFPTTEAGHHHLFVASRIDTCVTGPSPPRDAETCI